MHALDALELDVRRGRGPRDERDRPAARAPRRPAPPPRRARPRRSGPARTTQTWWSGTSVSARRPQAAHPSSTMVPVSAMASAQPVSTPSTASSARDVERRPSSTALRPAHRPARRPGAATSRARAARAAGLGERRLELVGRGPRARSRGTRPPARRSARPAPPSRRLRPRRGSRAAPRARRAPARARRGYAPSISSRASLIARSLHQSRKLCAGSSGSSRMAVQPRSGPTGSRASGPRPSRASRWARLVAAARRRTAAPAPAWPRARRATPSRLLAHHAPAQVHQHRRDVDLHRADLVAGPAQAGRVRQRRRARRAPQLRA